MAGCAIPTTQLLSALRESGDRDRADLEVGRTYVRRQEWVGAPPALEPYALFSSSDPASAERLATPFLGRHRLVPRRGTRSDFSATMHAVVLGPVTFGHLCFAGPAELELGASAARFLIVEPMSGPTVVRRGVTGWEVAPHRAIVIQPGTPTALSGPAGAAHLVVGLEQQAVLVHLSRLLGRSLDRPLVFEPEMDLEAATASRWNLAVEMLHAELGQHGSLLRSGLGQAQLEDFMMSSLLYGHRSSYSALLSRVAHRPEHHAARAAMEFIDLHLSEPLSVGVVAVAAGVSARTLQAAFKVELRTTPTAYIRSRRLERARADMGEASTGLTVTDVATRWGFTHLGRFAAEYRERFGESPSQTLRRGRSSTADEDR